jgi:ceramide synthetase
VFDNWPNPTSNSVGLLYLTQLSFYIVALWSLVFSEIRLKDWYEFVFHHTVTMSLLVLSWRTCQTPVGSVILLLHDLTDILLYWAKSAHTLKAMAWANAFFGSFAVGFFLLRLIYFPAIISWCIWHPVHLHPNFLPSTGLFTVLGIDAVFRFDHHYFCILGICFNSHWATIIFLCLLCCLHCFWFILILKTVKKALRGGVQVIDHDPRLELDKEKEHNKAS